MLFEIVAMLALGQLQVDQSEITRMGNSVERISADGHIESGGREYSDVPEYLAAAAIPASDDGKFFITVLTMRGCGGCEKLKQDWASSETLKALAIPGNPDASWAHLNIYDKDNDSQQWRGFAPTIKSYPWIVVQAPRTGRYGPPTDKIWEGTYDGDPARLYNTIWGKVQERITRYFPVSPAQPQPQPGPVAPVGPTPLPYSPAPSPPTVAPAQPLAPASTAPVVTTSKPQVFVVVDPHGIGEEVKVQAIKTAAELVRTKFLGDAKVTLVNFADAKTLGIPLVVDQTPAIFVVTNGRVEAFASSTLVDSITQSGGFGTGGLGIAGALGALLMLIVRFVLGKPAAATQPAA